ncbi:hypothetical protein ABPG74_013262 [Tetrahymena malaccensis]
MKVAVFSLLWPKNNFSAACVRTFGYVLCQLKENQETLFISPSKKTKQQISDIQMFSNVKIYEADYNNFESMDILLSKQLNFVPDIAIFDTFVCEEKFSHYIHTKFPNCMKVLDLQDIHSLRHKRQQIVEDMDDNLKQKMIQNGDQKELDPEIERNMMKTVLQEGFPSGSESDEFNREMASMLRSDLVITCSDYEYFRLKNHLNIHNTELLTFFHETPSLQIDEKEMNFQKKKNFVWIGNQSHFPNADSLKYIINYIWPKIHERLPDAQLHIYGSNFKQEFSNLDKLNINIFSRGVMPSLERLAKYRVMLAPLRYGAGIKGKIVDSWLYKVPVVTSPIGAEGLYYDTAYESIYTDIDQGQYTYKDMMAKINSEQKYNQQKMESFYSYSNLDFANQPDHLKFGGKFWNFTVDDYVKSSIELYTNEEEWKKSVIAGNEICNRRMGFTRNNLVYLIKFNEYLMNLRDNRKRNNLYNLTWSETLRSTQNFAKYINEKNRNKLFSQKHMK